MTERIPFNQPHMTGKELLYIARAHFNGRLAGDGPFTARCHGWLEADTGAARALLTHSCERTPQPHLTIQLGLRVGICHPSILEAGHGSPCERCEEAGVGRAVLEV